jgi:hypothetical protein
MAQCNNTESGSDRPEVWNFPIKLATQVHFEKCSKLSINAKI